MTRKVPNALVRRAPRLVSKYLGSRALSKFSKAVPYVGTAVKAYQGAKMAAQIYRKNFPKKKRGRPPTKGKSDVFSGKGRSHFHETQQVGTLSRFNYRHKYFALSKFYRKVPGLKIWKIQSSGYLYSSVPGQSYASTIFKIYDCADLNSIGSLINTEQALTSTNQTNFKWFNQNCSANIQFKNPDIGAVQLTIYDLIVRRDMDYQQRNSFGTSTTDPVAAWQQSYALNATAGNDNLLPTINSSPISAPLFTKHYWIKNKETVRMLGGQEHNHRVYIAPNKMFDNTLLNYEQATNLTSGTYYLGKMSYVCMVQIQGGLGLISAGGGKVTTAQPDIAYLLNKTYKYSYINESKPLVHLTSTIQTSGTILVTEPLGGTKIENEYNPGGL